MTLLGSGKFDKLTKVLHTFLGSTDPAAVESFVCYVIDAAYSAPEEMKDDLVLNARFKWAVEQVSGIIRSTEIPRDDKWIELALQFLTLHGFFQVKKKSKDSSIIPVRSLTSWIQLG